MLELSTGHEIAATAAVATRSIEAMNPLIISMSRLLFRYPNIPQNLVPAKEIRTMFSYLPPTWFVDKLRGKNGNVNFFRIVVKRGPFQAAVYAQERYTWPRLLLKLVPFVSAANFQIMQHEVEVQAAALVCGADEDAYRFREARGMLAYEELYDLGAEEIERRMVECRDKAARWVRRKRKLLDRAKNA